MLKRIGGRLRKRSEPIEETLDSKLTIQPTVQKLQGNSSATSLVTTAGSSGLSIKSSLESYRLGQDQLLGLNGEKVDEKKAFKNIKRAAHKNGGLIQAQAVLGFCYEFGAGTEQDFAAAEVMYLSAAKCGNGLAQARMAFLRRYGRPSIKIDRIEAEEWLGKVSEIGSSAIEWLIMAAESCGHAAATYCLGVCYHDGIGVDKNPELAVRYYKMSAEKGQPRGEGILGYCYGEGFGVEKDELKALELYLKAASKGESVSMYNVAHCYEEG